MSTGRPELVEAPSRTEQPFDELRANGHFVMISGKLNILSRREDVFSGHPGAFPLRGQAPE